MGIAEDIANYFYNILYSLFSPILNLITWLFNFITSTLNDFQNLIVALLGLFSTITHFISTFIGALLPSPIVALILIALGLVVVLRIYSFVKDVSIAGFKI